MRLTTLLGLLLCLACATASPQRTQWYAQRDAHPLQFRSSAEVADAVWARAQQCVATISPGEVFPVQVVTDVLIQTAQSGEFADARIWMTVNRIRQPDGSSIFSFSAGSNNPLQAAKVGRVAKGCSYFADTRISVPP